MAATSTLAPLDVVGVGVEAGVAVTGPGVETDDVVVNIGCDAVGELALLLVPSCKSGVDAALADVVSCRVGGTDMGCVGVEVGGGAAAAAVVEPWARLWVT